MDKNNYQKLIDAAAEQWVNIVFAHIRHKKQNKAVKKYKNNYAK